jgi:hypothetical protein
MGDFLTRHPEFLNPGKQQVLNVVAQRLSRPEVANWFDDMHDSASDKFLAKALSWGPPSRGVHKELFDKLMRVEPQLLSRGVTVAREHRTAHGAGGMSPHGWGVAIDIDYEDNPYILGDTDAGRVANGNASRALHNALLLLKGEDRAINSSYLSSLSVKPTAEIYDTLKDLDDAFIQYLGLDGDAAGITAQLQQLTAPGKAAAALQGQSPGDATNRWLGEIRQDKQNLKGAVGTVPTNFRQGSALTGVPRDATKGFLTLSKDLVVALRDTACLAWGAVDFGPTVSGDFQHFDTRRIPGAGREIMRQSGSFIPPPCGP